MMHSSPDPSKPTPRVHLFCPSCGEPTTIRAMVPLLFEPMVREIRHQCSSCGTETKVRLERR
jgi:predicted RNA-binding Zn-ribbon protein involved in translation (DUF1610 family)